MRNRTYIFLLATAAIFTACDSTDVELYEGVNSHKVEALINYDWSAVDTLEHQSSVNYTTTKPTKMEVYGDRIIKAWKWSNKKVAANAVTSDTTLQTGCYKFLTLNRNTKVFDYTEFDSTANQSTDRWNMKDLVLTYKTFAKNDLTVTSVMSNWIDHNAYSTFVRNDLAPVYVDTIEIKKFDVDTSSTVAFTPQALTQHLRLTFKIKKDFTARTQFRINSVKTEIAGIPAVIYPYNNKVDVTKTYKMVKAMNIATKNGGTTDSYENDSLICSVDIDVAGIIHGESVNNTTGPGIMQVVMYTTASSAPIQCRINLYNALRNSQIMRYENGTNYAYQNKKYAIINTGVTLKVSKNGVSK